MCACVHAYVCVCTPTHVYPWIDLKLHTHNTSSSYLASSSSTWGRRRYESGRVVLPALCLSAPTYPLCSCPLYHHATRHTKKHQHIHELWAGQDQYKKKQCSDVSTHPIMALPSSSIVFFCKASRTLAWYPAVLMFFGLKIALGSCGSLRTPEHDQTAPKIL